MSQHNVALYANPLFFRNRERSFSMELTIDTEKVKRSSGNIAILKIRGQINQDNVYSLENAVQNIYDGGIGRLILDLEDVSGMTSSAFGLLISFTQHPNAQSGICLINVENRFKTLFDLLGLSDRMHIMESKQKAIEFWG